MKNKDQEINKSSAGLDVHPSSLILHPSVGLPYELFLALRYLRSRRGQKLARFTAASATLGIAGGVGALIVALALANGFRDEMRDKILRGTAHITAARADGYPLTNWRDVAAQLRVVPGVVTVSATSYDGALVAGADQATYAVLRGVDTENRAATLELRRVLIDGELDLRPAVEAKKESTPSHITEESGASNFSSFDGATHDFASLPTAVIGAELAARTNLRVGDTGKIISAGAALADPESVPRQQRVRIAGVFRTGLYEYDATWIYISLVTAADLVGAPLSASAMSIEIADPERVAEAAAAVRARLGEKFVVVDWREANRPLFAALSLERRVILTIIALIVMVAALNIATALALLVIERRPDIAILGALGARPANVMLIFLLEGALIGAVGAAGGIALGLAAADLGNRYELIKLPADVYSISAVPFHAEWRDVVGAALSAFALSLAATIYPAQAAARVRPAEVLRYD